MECFHAGDSRQNDRGYSAAGTGTGSTRFEAINVNAISFTPVQPNTLNSTPCLFGNQSDSTLFAETLMIINNLDGENMPLLSEPYVFLQGALMGNRAVACHNPVIQHLRRWIIDPKGMLTWFYILMLLSWLSVVLATHEKLPRKSGISRSPSLLLQTQCFLHVIIYKQPETMTWYRNERRTKLKPSVCVAFSGQRLITGSENVPVLARKAPSSRWNTVGTSPY